MEDIVLEASKREVIGKQVKALRRKGGLPAVIYGHGIDPFPITLKQREASRALSVISSTQLVEVRLDGKPHITLVREKQRHPVSGMYLHVDFQEVSMTEKLRAKVSIELVGEAPAVKYNNGVIVIGVEVLEIEAFPRDLPERIQVDISILAEIGASIHVRDLVLPGTVEVLVNPDEMIVLVGAPEADEALIEGEGMVGEPEVIERGKKEEDNF